MRVGVIGAGAMGSRYGAALARVGYDVTLVDVWQEHVDAINSRGLEVVSPSGAEIVKVRATTRPETVGVVDLVIIFTKAVHTESAIKSAAPMIGPDTMVMTLQNGLGNVEAIEKWVPRDRIIAGVTDFPSDMLGPGRIGVTGVGTTKMQVLGSSRSAAFQAVYEAFSIAGLNPEASADVMATIWSKVAFNAAINATSAIARLSVGDVGQSREAWDIMERVVEEAVAVAACEGVTIKAGDVVARLKHVSQMREHGDHITSMLQDVLHKRTTEVASLNGAISERGRKYGVPTPFNQCLYDLITLIQQNYDRQR